MLQITPAVQIDDDEIELTAIRSQGAGGQNVNKVATAIHLRFAIHPSSLPDVFKQQLLASKDRRISKDGIIIIKAQRFRSQEKNRDDALQRLQALIRVAIETRKPRRPTKPGKAARQKRMDQKSQRGKTKSLRGKPPINGH